jgi:AcrR family transcriptional regulator
MTPGDIDYSRSMGRWEPDAQGRLGSAAMELFSERGFDDTTVAEIAERAGLTKRTFFRYFADKREVLFGGAQMLEELFVTAVENAPGPASAFDAMAAALDASATMFEQRREFAAQRQQIIAANPDLQERELIKLASLAAAVASALRRRGVGDPAAILTAEAGLAVFRVAFERWIDPANEQELRALLVQALAELRAVTAA